MTVTFFGHRDTPPTVEPYLRKAILHQAEQGSTLFLVGNEGLFDRMAAKILQQLCAENQALHYYVVLAYLPKEDFEHPTLFPEGLEKTPRRFAISARNRWMLERSDAVIVYAPYVGNARAWKEAALKKGRVVTELIVPIDKNETEN